MKDKIESITGFALKAGNVMFGADNLENAKKKFYLIFMCESTALNTQKRVLHIAETKNVPVIMPKVRLENIVSRLGCKVAAITDLQMSRAIVERVDENYRLIYSEVKN